jgi:diguanylate cyclase (GGDEF)-like protein
MDRTILLLGQDDLGKQTLSEVLEQCELPQSKLINKTSIKTAETIAVDPGTWLIIINALDYDSIRKFLTSLQIKNNIVPVIVVHNCVRKDLEVLISLGACEIINPSNIDENLLTQTILSAVERKRIEAELIARDVIMQAVNYAAEVFLLHADWESRIDGVLNRLGEATQADKVCMYRNVSREENGIHAVLHANWVQNHNPINFPDPRDLDCASSEFFNSRWKQILSEGEVVFGLSKDFLLEEKQELEKRHILSIAIIPVFSDQVLWGFLIFEFHCIEKRWTREEVESLRTAARIFGAGISRVDAETRLAHLATHDFLTNLPNRMLLEDRFDQAIARAERSKKKFAIIAVDLDKFKQVNDTYGHPFGDQVLVEIAWRLSEAVRTSDTCARVGGDEFTILAEGINTKQDLKRVMEKISLALNDPIQIEGKSLKVTASLGASIYPDHGTEMEELMKSADIALYQVKDAYSGHRIFSPAKQIFLIEKE